MQEKPNRVTIRDVAEAAGVSFQTVSLVLNHPEKVAQKTLQHVRAVIKSLDFVPSMAARSLRRIPTRTLACVFFGKRASYDNRTYQIQDTYWNNVVQTINRVADRAGYAVQQRSQGADDETLYEEIRNLFLGGRIDGLIAVVERTAHPVLLRLQEQGFPLVIFGTRDAQFSFVAQDNAQACAEVVDHLVAGGCHALAFISGERDGHGNDDVDERYRGYRAGLERHGLAMQAGWNLAGDWSMASGYRIAQQLWNAAQRPDGLIFASDRMALGALKGLYDLGVRVPHDIAVVGFDNMQYDDFCVPPLTSVHSPVLEMADAAVRMLLARITGQPDPGDSQQVLATRLVVRQSTRSANPGSRG